MVYCWEREICRLREKRDPTKRGLGEPQGHWVGRATQGGKEEESIWKATTGE